MEKGKKQRHRISNIVDVDPLIRSPRQHVNTTARRSQRQHRPQLRQEEDPHHLLQETDLPAGGNVRREALSKQLRASGPGQRVAAHRDPGEDLVPEPTQQAQEAAVGGQRRAGQRACAQRLQRERPSTGHMSASNSLPGFLSQHHLFLQMFWTFWCG